MLLDEWLIRRKRIDKDFSLRTMSKALKINYYNLCKVKNGVLVPSLKMALKIEEFTNGQVHGWELIKHNKNIKEKREKKSCEDISS